jgi:Zn-dependent protease with chaperone function
VETRVFDALIFGPGLPATGARSSLRLHDTSVEIATGNLVRRAALTELTLREVGFGKPGIELAWRERGDEWLVHVLDPAAAAQFISSSPIESLPQAKALTGRQRKTSTGRIVAWTGLSLIVLLPLLLLWLFYLQADRLAAWVSDRIPVEKEMQAGRQLFASMQPTLILRDSGAAIDAVRQIGQRLTQGSRYRYEFHVVQDDSLNAYALPGGVVVVHTALIAATKRPEELAGVLAHEVQHVELRHSLHGAVKNLGLKAVWALTTGDLGSSLAGQAALQLTSLKFSRQDETAADDKGFASLVAQKIDPSGMAEFFKTMSEKAPDAPVAFVSTHPLSEDRLRELNARLNAMQRRDSVSLGFSAWPPTD